MGSLPCNSTRLTVVEEGAGEGFIGLSLLHIHMHPCPFRHSGSQCHTIRVILRRKPSQPKPTHAYGKGHRLTITSQTSCGNGGIDLTTLNTRKEHLDEFLLILGRLAHRATRTEALKLFFTPLRVTNVWHDVLLETRHGHSRIGREAFVGVDFNMPREPGGRHIEF